MKFFAQARSFFRRSPSDARRESDSDSQRCLFGNALHIFVLTTFAISEPLLDRAAHRDVFLAHFHFLPLLLLVLVFCVLLPAFIVLLEWQLDQKSRASRERLHAFVVYFGFTVMSLQVYKALPGIDGLAIVALAIVTGLLATWRYFRSSRWGAVLTISAPAVLLFPALFFYEVAAARPVARPDGIPKLKVRHPVPVVVVALDECCGTSLLDAQREIDAARYPHFAALARECSWFRNATSVHPRTGLAVPAILSGRYPKGTPAPDVGSYPQNLFTLLLATEKYQLTSFESLTALCPPIGQAEQHSFLQQWSMLCSTLWSIYLYDLWPSASADLSNIPLAWFGVWTTASEVRRGQRAGIMHYVWDSNRDVQFDHFLDCLQPSKRLTLHFAHFGLPHYPWCYLPSGKRYCDIASVRTPEGQLWGSYAELSDPEGETWGNDDLVSTHYYQRYLLQLGYVDYQLGRLVERLKKIGLFDRCLLVIVADHGVAFRPNYSRRSPQASTLPDIMSVPLFVKLPNQHVGNVSDRNVETIDVLPTITETLGIDVPTPLDGVSVFAISVPERSRKLFCDEKGKILVEDAAFESKYTTLQDMLARFGTGADPGKLFRIGPHPELIGRGVSELQVGDRSDVKITLSHPTSFHWSEDAPIVPCYFDGKVTLDPARTQLPIELAIAVNGTIGAVTRTYALPDIKYLWSAMLPETALSEGDNDVQIFQISPSGDALRLRPCFP